LIQTQKFKFKEITKVSTKFYIKNDNGNILSMDGKTRYTLLEGKAAYDFLKTEDGKRRCFHVEIDENGDKLGIEANPEIEKQYEADERHARYLRQIEVECNITVVSANMLVSVAGEDDIEMVETFADQETDVECGAMRNMDLQSLRKALSKLLKEEYDLIYQLFLAEEPLTERQYGAVKGIPQKTVNCRKQAILGKLKKFL
jgi:DNA-directed RNA polymerase specialized sigma subunit